MDVFLLHFKKVLKLPWKQKWRLLFILHSGKRSFR